MNDFKYIKPSGAIKLPDNSNIEVKDGKVKVKDIPIVGIYLKRQQDF